MYNVTNEEITQLRSLLQANGLDDTTLTDEQLCQLIQQSVTLIGEDYVTGSTEVEYDYDFNGDMYMTMSYPIIADEVTVKLDGLDIPVEDILHITSEGVIRFRRELEGLLEVHYRNGLPGSTMTEYLLLATLHLIRGGVNGTGNISSITEGDVNVSYDNTTNSSNSLNGVITAIHGLYGARVRMI